MWSVGTIATSASGDTGGSKSYKRVSFQAHIAGIRNVNKTGDQLLIVNTCSGHLRNLPLHILPSISPDSVRYASYSLFHYSDVTVLPCHISKLNLRNQLAGDVIGGRGLSPGEFASETSVQRFLLEGTAQKGTHFLVLLVCRLPVAELFESIQQS